MFSKMQTAGIILAAGASTRFGRPKQLARLGSRYLLEWALDAALNSRLQTVVLVLGHAHQEIIQAMGPKVRHPKVEVVVNADYREGQSTSLKVGLDRIGNAFSSVMYLLADQPMADSDTIDLLLREFHESDKDICVPVFKGQRGNPALFKRSIYDEIMLLGGDIGAREIIDKDADRVLGVEIEDPLCFFDIDTSDDLETLLGRIADNRGEKASD